MRKILYIILMFFTQLYSVAYSGEIDKILPNHHENVSDTLYVLDKIFSEHKENYLVDISTSNFVKTNFFDTLKRYIKNTNINFNHRIESCNKRFMVENKKRTVLTVTLQRNVGVDNMWYLKDAYLTPNDIKEKIGFSPLSIYRYFEELSDIINKKDIELYSRLTEYGKLDEVFFKNYNLKPMKHNDVTIKNIVLHKKGIVKEMIYLTLQYYYPGTKDSNKYKSGWLISKAGPVSELYPSEEDIYIDFKLGKLKVQDLNLDKANELVSVNLGSEAINNVLENVPSRKKFVKEKGQVYKNKIDKITCIRNDKQKPKYLKIVLNLKKRY